MPVAVCYIRKVDERTKYRTATYALAIGLGLAARSARKRLNGQKRIGAIYSRGFEPKYVPIKLN
jgi:hypothetical protein